MKLIGILCWYDESPGWLSSAIASYANVGLTHLIAVDGSFELFPGGRPRSGTEQHEAILEVAHACALGTCVWTPDRLWREEREKRSFAFQLAEQVAAEDESDWYCVFDADEMVVALEENVPKVLVQTKLHVATVTFMTRHDSQQPVPADVDADTPTHYGPIPRFFRAIPGLRVTGNHYTYMTPDGRVLFGNTNASDEYDVCPAVDLGGVVVDHRTQMRHWRRQLEQRAYYRIRDREGAERGPCAYCDDVAQVMLPGAYRRKRAYVENGWIEVCEKHIKKLVLENEAAMKDLALPRAEILRMVQDARRSARRKRLGFKLSTGEDV